MNSNSTSEPLDRQTKLHIHSANAAHADRNRIRGNSREFNGPYQAARHDHFWFLGVAGENSINNWEKLLWRMFRQMVPSGMTRWTQECWWNWELKQSDS